MAVSHKRTTIGIIRGNGLLRDYLGKALRTQADMTCSISSSSALDVANLPDVILLDSYDASPATLSQLARSRSEIKIVVINADAERLNAVECIRQGVAGFLSKDAGLNEIATAIREVANGGWAVPRPIVFRLCQQLSQEQHNSVGAAMSVRLTNRESKIVGLVSEGWTNKEIAQKLNIAPSTVKNHVHNILQKLGFRRRPDLITYYLRTTGFAK